MFNLARRITGDPVTARDVARTAFLKAFERLDRYDPADRFVPWLLRIVHNTARDAGRLGDGGDRATPVDGDSGPTTARMVAVFDRLAADYQVAITLHYQESLSYAEVALVMGMSEAAARSCIAHGRRALARLMAGEAGGASGGNRS